MFSRWKIENPIGISFREEPEGCFIHFIVIMFSVLFIFCFSTIIGMFVNYNVLRYLLLYFNFGTRAPKLNFKISTSTIKPKLLK